jgi:hypothetical protein
MAQPKRRSAKKLNDFLCEHYASVTYINKCIKYINLLYNHIHHGANLSDYRKGWANIALHTTPSSRLVTTPMVDDQTIRTDPARHNTWLTYARMARKELWKSIHQEEVRLRQESSERFNKTLRFEEKKGSRLYRSMVYPKKQAHGDQITILTDDGKLEFTAEGILEASKQYWSTLGTPGNVHNHDAPKPWMHNAKYAQIRSRMLQEDPSSIRSPLDMATLRYILHHTKKGTAPGLDNVGYDTLRTLLWLEDCPDDDEESSLTAKRTNEAREAILSLLLGLIKHCSTDRSIS